MIDSVASSCDYEESYDSCLFFIFKDQAPGFQGFILVLSFPFCKSDSNSNLPAHSRSFKT